MKSPFPGMDPYLEGHWLDVHSSLVIYARNQLQPQLPAGLVARTSERLVVDAPYDEERAIFPDVRVVEQPQAQRVSARAGETAVAEPLVLQIPRARFRQGFVEIRDRQDEGRLVTVIEFLSPSNKTPGDGRRQYRRKRDELVAAEVNLVEVDLTRAGRRELLVAQEQIPREYQTVYQACAFTAWADKPIGIYALPLSASLPSIQVPLRESDRPVLLDLQSLVDRAYEDGRYDSIDYARPCNPPLEGEDAVWADELLKAAGKR
ncbi:MAG: hypothetical protein AMXMBFR13_46690 [Phycisphaerae bacterium]